MSVAASREWAIKNIYWADEFLSSEILTEQTLDSRVSYVTAREILLRCLSTGDSIWFSLLIETNRSKIKQNCITFAEAVVATELQHAEAHLLLAQAAIAEGEYQKVTFHITSSSVLAPRDRFNIEWRLLLSDKLVRHAPNAKVEKFCVEDLRRLSQRLPNSEVLTMLKVTNSPLNSLCL